MQRGKNIAPCCPLLGFCRPTYWEFYLCLEIHPETICHWIVLLVLPPQTNFFSTLFSNILFRPLGVPVSHWFTVPFSILSSPIPLLSFSRAAYSSALKMEAAGSSETLVYFYQTAWRNIPEDSNPFTWVLPFWGLSGGKDMYYPLQWRSAGTGVASRCISGAWESWCSIRWQWTYRMWCSAVRCAGTAWTPSPSISIGNPTLIIKCKFSWRWKLGLCW
jgi:hypothetical protein